MMVARKYTIQHWIWWDVLVNIFFFFERCNINHKILNVTWMQPFLYIYPLLFWSTFILFPLLNSLFLMDGIPFANNPKICYFNAAKASSCNRIHSIPLLFNIYNFSFTLLVEGNSQLGNLYYIRGHIIFLVLIYKTLITREFIAPQTPLPTQN